MKPLSLFLAWRYLWGPRKEGSISIMITICFMSILIGSCALTLVLGIMRGFEKQTHETLQGVHAQIIMRAFGEPLAVDQIAPILNSEFPEIRAWSSSEMRQAIIQHPTSDDISNIIMLKGINPEQEASTTGLYRKVSSTHLDHPQQLASLLTDKHIMIGEKLARNLNLTLGDEVYLLITQDTQTRSKKISLDRTQAFIGGIFKTGIEEYDAGVAFCSLSFLETLFPEASATQINIALHANADEQEVIDRLRIRFSMEVYSWQDLYPALVSALKLEKYAMGLILTLIILVASMNIVSLIFMQITQKRGDIAILQAMGTSNATIQSIFVWIGMLISIIATGVGILFAFILAQAIKRYPLIELPDAYYVTHLPVELDASIGIIVFALILCITFCTTILAARSTRAINISNVLRFEA